MEAYPVAAGGLARAAQALQATDAHEGALLAELQPCAQALATAWTALRPDLPELRIDQDRVALTLAVGGAQPMQALPRGPVDAVYLDGFNPARNPAMWSEVTLQGVARLCRPGTRLSSRCVAGAMRAQLQALGFAVHRRAGLPPKWRQLEADEAPASEHSGCQREAAFAPAIFCCATQAIEKRVKHRRL